MSTMPMPFSSTRGREQQRIRVRRAIAHDQMGQDAETRIDAVSEGAAGIVPLRPRPTLMYAAVAMPAANTTASARRCAAAAHRAGE